MPIPYDYIRARKRYWLLPVLIPALLVHGCVVASRNVMRAMQRLEFRLPALSRKLQSAFAAAWVPPHLRHSRRA
jgi:hypothetical protein